MTLSQYIHEAISSGKNRYLPEEGCSIDRIVSWLEMKDIKGRTFAEANSSFRGFMPDKVSVPIYIVGPCTSSPTTWVTVANIPSPSGPCQRVVMKPLDPDKSFYAEYGDEHVIPFEMAVQMADAIVDNPKKYADPKDFVRL